MKEDVLSPHPLHTFLRTTLALLLLADLLWVACDFNPISPQSLVQLPLPPELRHIIATAGDGRIAGTGSILSPNVATIYGFLDPRGYDQPKSYRLGNVLRTLHINALNMSLLLRERVAPTIEPALASWLDRYSVRLLLTVVPVNELTIGSSPSNSGKTPSSARPPFAARGLASPATSPQTPPDRPWPLVQQSPDCCVYANPNAYPRAFIPTQAQPGNASESLHALLDPTTDLRQKTIYEPPESKIPESPSTLNAAPIPVNANATGAVRITNDGDEQITLDVQTPTGGLVVLGDNMSPGWTVKVDDARAQPLTANYLFRAVQVPPGHHTVNWSYQIPWLQTGSIISALTLIVLLGLVFLRRSALLSLRERVAGTPAG